TYLAGNNPQHPADPQPEEIWGAALEPMALFELHLGTRLSGRSALGPFVSDARRRSSRWAAAGTSTTAVTTTGRLRRRYRSSVTADPDEELPCHCVRPCCSYSPPSSRSVAPGWRGRGWACSGASTGWGQG